MATGQLIQDEYGRPFILLREQGKKQRVQGLAAMKVRIALLPAYLNVSTGILTRYFAGTPF